MVTAFRVGWNGGENAWSGESLEWVALKINLNTSPLGSFLLNKSWHTEVFHSGTRAVHPLDDWLSFCTGCGLLVGVAVLAWFWVHSTSHNCAVSRDTTPELCFCSLVSLTCSRFSCAFYTSNASEITLAELAGIRCSWQLPLAGWWKVVMLGPWRKKPNGILLLASCLCSFLSFCVCAFNVCCHLLSRTGFKVHY